MNKKIISLIMCVSVSLGIGVVPVLAEENAEEMVVVRNDSFEEYLPSALTKGSAAYPREGEYAGLGALTADGGNFKTEREDKSGGFALSLNDGVEGNLVPTTDANGNKTNAVQIKRNKGAVVSAANFLLNPLPEYKTSRLTYSLDIRNGGSCTGAKEGEGFTNKVNNYFGTLSLLGITLDFNTKNVVFPESLTSKPVVTEKVEYRSLPDNGEWFNLKVDINVLSDTVSVYINNKLVGTQLYGGKYKKISGSDAAVSLGQSGDDENALYIDNVHVEKSTMTADELERIYNDKLFSKLGKSFVMYPGSGKVYYDDVVEYFDESGAISPILVNGETFVPVRYIAEKMGYSVIWNEDRSVFVGEYRFAESENKLLVSNGTSYINISDMANVIGYKSYIYSSGLAFLLPNEVSVPNDANMIELTNLYPEACLGFEIEGGWYTEADLLSAANVKESELGVTHAVGGRVKHTDYATLRNGMERSTKNVKSGKYSGKWDRHNFYPTLMTTGAPSDWTSYNTLSFWVYSEVATNEHITVGAVSNPHDSYSDYVINEYTTNFFYSEFYVDFTGWKKFEIPLSDFKASTEQAVGFNKIDGLYFYSRAFDYEPYPQTVLYLDDIKLEVLSDTDKAAASEKYNEPILKKEAEINAPKDYVLDVPEIFKAVSLLDWGYVLEYKKEIENNTDKAVTSKQKLDEIYKKYGIKNDTYKYSDLVVQDNLSLTDEELPIEKLNLNHKFPEIVEQPAEGYLNTMPYFKEARAITGYNPKFIPTFVSTWDDFKYMYYAAHMLEYVDYEGTWHLYDYSKQIERYCKDVLGFESFKVRCNGFYDETKLRFDNDGDAYTTLMVSGTYKDGSSATVGILGHSRDKLKSWTYYKLPRPFTKMEILDGHNKDCLNGPPVILLHNYWSNSNDARGAFVIPEKQADGTLVIPEETIYSEMPVICTSQHSGKANFVQTVGDKVFIVYGVCYENDSTQQTKDFVKTLIPQNHEIWGIINSQLKQYMVSEFGVPSFIIEYDKKTKKLSEPVFLATAGSEYHDGHNWSAISVDSEGYLNVFVIGHHFPLLYCKSKKPADISEWEPIEVISSGISYASMNIDSNDTVYAITRNSNDGYTFDICLQKKEKGGKWEESRIVKYWKQYYMVWGDDVYMDPKTDDLYVMFRSKTNWMELFADEWAAKDFIFPDASVRFTDSYPLGTAAIPVRQYANSGSNVKGEHTLMVSHDHGKTWQMALTEDFMPKK